MTEAGDFYAWAPRPQNSRKPTSLIGDGLGKKKLTVEVSKPQKPDGRYNSTTEVRKSARFSLMGLFSGRAKNQQLAFGSEVGKLTVARVTTPTYYMRNLQFNFRLTQDDNFSMSYKEHFHKNWIDLRFNAGQIELRNKDVHFRRVELPPADGDKLTVVFNLDETLVSCCKDLSGDATISISYKGKEINVS